MKYKLPKSNRLCSETSISSLYRTGKAFLVFPIRVVFKIESRTAENKQAVRVLFSAPKRRFRHAVDRNRYRRLLRETYRLRHPQLMALLDEHDMTMNFSLTAINNELPEYKPLCHTMDKIVDHLEKEIRRKAEKRALSDDRDNHLSVAEDENR